MHELSDFDFDKATADAWAQFGERLAEVLGVIDDGGVLTIGTLSAKGSGSPYVRFVHEIDAGVDRLRAEASGNANLDPTEQLTVQQQEALSGLGWRRVDGEQNYIHYDNQDDCSGLAALAVTTLRDVFGVPHPVFLQPDDLAEILQPAPADVVGAQPLADPALIATMPRDRAHLDEMVTTEITHMFGHDPLRDADGDIAIRVGSTMVFIRSTADAAELVLYSALVHDVEGRSRAMEVLNDLNTDSRYGRFALHRDRVFLTMSLLVRPFVPAHLHAAVRIISQIADAIDDELAAKLRGRTTFDSPDL